VQIFGGRVVTVSLLTAAFAFSSGDKVNFAARMMNDDRKKRKVKRRE